MTQLLDPLRRIPSGHLFAALVILISVITLLPTIYLGTSGPYYFDSGKLTPVTDWVNGTELNVFETKPFNPRMFGRVLGFATFVAEGQLTGGELDPLVSKSINVAIHLVCAVGLFFLIYRLILHTRYGSDAHMIALVAVALWILSPANLGTAFYAVQRLAQLASLFMILGLIAYTTLRSAPRGPVATVALVLAYVTCLVLAIASKELGFNLLLYTLVIEFFFFRFRNPWISSARLFAAVTATALALGIAILYAKPEYFSYYDVRPFNMAERLLTQMRIIPMYIADLLLPSEHATGLFKEVKHSTGLFSPMTTFYGFLALSAYGAGAALLYYFGLHVVAFGLVFFAVGHVMESSIIPLELHFRHRNYLPSIGLYLALVGGAYTVATRFHRKPLVAAIACIYLVFIGAATYARAGAWSSTLDMGAAAYHYNPDSYRAATTYARLLVQAGRFDTAFTLLDKQINDNPDNDFIFRIQRLYYSCVLDRPVTKTTYNELAAAHTRAPDIEISSALKLLTESGFKKGQCSDLSVDRLVEALGDFAASQHAVDINEWYVHYYRARMLLYSEQEDSAVSLLEKLVDGGHTKAGLMLADIHLRSGRQEKANAVLDKVAKDMSLDSIEQFGITEDRMDRHRGVILEAK